MDNPNGKCESSNPELEEDDVKKIDLTLKLGPSLQYKENQEEDNAATCRGSQGFFGTSSQSSNDMVLASSLLSSYLVNFHFLTN